MILQISELNLKNPKGFVVIEGPNGAGKSTLLRSLEAEANQRKKKSLLTFEPGDSVVGKNIRKILLGQDDANCKIPSLSELFLFCADRNIHVEQIIKPALGRNELVFCDRYFYSTLAFQGYGRGLDLRQISDLSELATTGLVPDVVILLDLPAETGLSRTRSRENNDSDSFEAEALDFHRRLRDGFLKIAAERPEAFVIIDATQSIETVCQQGVQILEHILSGL